MSETDSRGKTLHIAPMLDVSTREFRALMRMLTRHATLWTEMVVDETLVHNRNDLDTHLGYAENGHPIVCQIGGNHPDWAFEATSMVQAFGYDEINLNMECPSDRVTGRREFGAALMKKPDLAAAMVEQMQASACCRISVSVKMRIGVDDDDSFEFLVDLIERLPTKRFILHARKVYTQGLNPLQNRRVPPLDYQRVYRICRHFPDYEFWINGGIASVKDAHDICYGTGVQSNGLTDPPASAPVNLRGAMLGRAAMDDPCSIACVDSTFYDQPDPCRTRREVIESYCAYLESIYPRRCCDDDPRPTTHFPGFKTERHRDFCGHCLCIYGQDGMGSLSVAKTRLTEPLADGSHRVNRHTSVKISSFVIDRSLKPIRGIFHGCPGTRGFRRHLDRLSRDPALRDCGPGFMVRVATSAMPAALLDQDIVPR